MMHESCELETARVPWKSKEGLMGKRRTAEQIQRVLREARQW